MLKFRAWHPALSRMMLIQYMWFHNSSIEELELNDKVTNTFFVESVDEIELMQST